MRSIKDYVTRLTLLAMLSLSVAGCGTGQGQATTPTPLAPAPVPSSTTISVPAAEPTTSTNAPGPKPTGGTDLGGVPGGNVMIDSVEVLIRESYPVQVSVSVKGNLSDACTSIDKIDTTRDGNTFNIGITTARPADAVCAQVLTPFEQNIDLDVRGLKKGTYTVNVNGTTQTFELATDQ